MRANRTLALSGSYDTEFSKAAPSGSSTHAVDLQNWKSRLAQLPAGQGVLHTMGTKSKITVQWDESRLRQGDSAQQFSPDEL
jgi:hypothetical protein